MSDLDDLRAVAPHLGDGIEEVLISRAQIDQKVAEIGARISEDYAEREPLLVGILKGAFVVMADLARHISVPSGVDFMAVSSYGSATRSSGVVRILKDLDSDIEDRHVLIVEDIIDSGLTLDYLLKNLRSRRPASLEVVTLLSKPSHHRVELPVRYHGFEVPDVFVVGYGLDYAERYRGLPFIGTLKPEVYERRS